MKKITAIFSVLLVLALVVACLPVAMAQSALEYKYDNSVLINFQTHISNQKTAQEFASLFGADACYVMDKQTKEESVFYQVIAVVENQPVEEVIKREENRMGVLSIGRNPYAPDYCEKESYLTLNQNAVEIPVGGTATLKLTDAHLVFDEKQETGIMVAVDHQALPFEQFRDMVTAMGSEEMEGDDAYFYALYEEDYNWEEQADYLFLGMWGSNEYDHRHKAQSPIGKYLIPIDCFFMQTTEETMNKFAEVPQITDVRLTYDRAHGGIPPHEIWTVGNYNIAAVAAENGDENGLFLTATVVGKCVGETVITVKHGYGTRICTATCTVNVVEKVATPTDTPTDIIWGDVTGDTKVDAKDALEVLKYAVNKTTFTAEQMLAAEVSGDQKINAKDALEILKYAVRKIEKFPIELLLSDPPTDIPSTPTDVPIDPNTPTDTPENPEPPVDEPGVPETPSTPTDTPTPPVEEPEPPLENPDEKIVGISSANFPDRYFNLYVRLQYDLNEDGWLSAGEIAGVTEMNIANEGVVTPAEQSRDNVIRLQSVKGIEYFTNLETLFVGGNELTQLDISSLTKLRYLNCTNNQLTSLDVSKNLELTDLHCNGNQLTQLNISNNLNLIDLNCNNNLLAQLDVSANGRLKTLYCESNQIKELQLANNPNLWILHCENNLIEQLDLTNNPKVSWLDCDETVTVIR